MKSPFAVSIDRYQAYVAWIDVDGEEGAHIGQEHKRPLAELRDAMNVSKNDRASDTARSDFQFYAVEIAAREWVSTHPSASRGHDGYEFESEASAKKFCAAMRAALKAADAEYDTGVPWPEWAKQATAAGWKPPKGWKP